MTIDQLRAGVSYDVRVYGRNDRGRGSFSQSLVIDTLASSKLSTLH